MWTNLKHGLEYAAGGALFLLAATGAVMALHLFGIVLGETFK